MNMDPLNHNDSLEEGEIVNEDQSSRKRIKLSKEKQSKRSTGKTIQVQNKLDYQKAKEDYLALTSKTVMTNEMNLDAYHKWLTDDSPLKHSKTLEVLKTSFSSKWNPIKKNRQDTIKIVSHPKVVLELILNEMGYKTNTLDMISTQPNEFKIILTITSKPQWSFFGNGITKEMALEDASQNAIQFLLLMSA